MKIHFDHNGKQCVAEFLYNLKAKEDCGLVVFESDFNEDILFSNIHGTWSSTSGLQSRHPQTYSNIIEALSAG